MKREIPLDEGLADQLHQLLLSAFGEVGDDLSRDVYLGAEAAHNNLTLYYEEEDSRPVSSCVTVRPRTMPSLAGFADVATEPAFRGRGLASTLCDEAVQEFRASGGEAFFLGTVNPEAARIYHRLGWRRLAGTNGMVNVSAEISPEEYHADYFRRPSAVTVEPASPADRIPIIPLIWTAHDDRVLDANVNLCSIRWQVQSSCIGLYPRYVRTLAESGAWFTARTEDGRVVGLSTALQDGDWCAVDGFAHQNFTASWQQLLDAAITWGRRAGARQLRARLCVEDEEKIARLESIGFTPTTRGAPFLVGDRLVASTILSTC